MVDNNTGITGIITMAITMGIITMAIITTDITIMAIITSIPIRLAGDMVTRLVDLAGMVDGATRAQNIIGDMVLDIGDNGNTKSIIRNKNRGSSEGHCFLIYFFVCLTLFLKGKVFK